MLYPFKTGTAEATGVEMMERTKEYEVVTVENKLCGWTRIGSREGKDKNVGPFKKT